jgi:tRNA (guanine37-N1)-methyltransferase
VRIDVFTIFPDYLRGGLDASLLEKARAAGVLDVRLHDPRAFTTDPHRSVDDTPFGGGAGMVLRPDVMDAAINAARPEGDMRPVLCLTPRGRLFRQADAARLAEGPGVVLVCGRYEGIDQRVIDAHAMDEISVGDYVLSGGEPAAAIVLDACIRLLPGVMGAAESAEQESFSGPLGGLLEYPHYTRPAEWQGRAAPSVLLSGDHAAIAAWRHEQALRTTRERRPDLLRAAVASAPAAS